LPPLKQEGELVHDKLTKNLKISVNLNAVTVVSNGGILSTMPVCTSSVIGAVANKAAISPLARFDCVNDNKVHERITLFLISYFIKTGLES
jgi:hypothetical protein